MSSSSTSPSPRTAVVVVVEAQCTAPRRDWPELASLLRCYLSRCLGAAQEQHVPFPFPPGVCIRWDHPAFARSGADALPAPPALLTRTLTTLRVCDMTDPALLLAPPSSSSLFPSPWQGGDGASFAMSTVFRPIFFALHAEPACAEEGGAGEQEEGDGEAVAALPSCVVWPLPHATLEGQWEALSYGESLQVSTALKRDLVEYVHTAMVFSMAGVDAHCIAWNRMVLLHGPPGTGKTSLSRALAHKLAVRLSGDDTPSATDDIGRDSGDIHVGGGASPASEEFAASPLLPSVFGHAKLVEINAHSLFSRWFSESGKQVMQLFVRIRRLAADPACLVCVLLDEVESLAAARQSAMRGNEPSDAIRVVNALLTQMDSLQHMRNVLVLATSNLTGAIDCAFLDRADKKVFVGPPGQEARRTILQSAVGELLQKGLVHFPENHMAAAATAAATRRRTTVTVETTRRADQIGEQHQRETHARQRDDNEEVENEHERGGEDDGLPPGDVFAHVVDTIETVAAACVGFNGRLLKKLPFLAFGACMSAGTGTFPAAWAVVPATNAAPKRADAFPPPPTPRTLKPDYMGLGSRTGSGGRGTTTATTGKEKVPQVHMGHTDHSGSLHSATGSLTVPSVPITVFLRCLQDAARREAETQARLAATAQHLSP